MDNDLCYIAFILDRSGSMESVRESAITGFDTFLKEQQADPQMCIFKLILFDHEYIVQSDWQEIGAIEPLTAESYVPRGNTALLDAIGRTIAETGARLAEMPEEARPGKVIIAILTDGLENASMEYGERQIVEMMEHQQEKYGWQFLFLSSDIRTQSSPVAMAAGVENNLAYDSTAEGTHTAFALTSSSNVTRMRHSQP